MDSRSFFKIVNDVISIWEKVKEMRQYEEKFGSLLFKTIFEKYPSVFESFQFGGEEQKQKKIFVASLTDLSINVAELEASSLYMSLTKKAPPQQKNLKQENDYGKDPKFVMHGKRWVRMFSLAIDMLGPDLEIVEDKFMGLGEQHVQYNVSRDQYRIMGKGLLKTLETTLGKEIFNKEKKDSWTKFYLFISKTMLQGMERHHTEVQKRSSERSSASTVSLISVASSISDEESYTRKSSKNDMNDDTKQKQRSSEASLAHYRQKILERRLSVRKV